MEPESEAGGGYFGKPYTQEPRRVNMLLQA